MPEGKEKDMGISATAPWIAFYGDTPATINYPRKTMYQMVSAAAKQYPNNIAYIFQGKETTYPAFMKRIEAAAKGLYNMGIRKGDRVTICMANTPQALDCFYALNRIGAIPNMIHPLSAASEIAFYLNVSHSKAILTLAQFYEKVASVQSQLEQPVTILIARIADELPFPLGMLYPITSGGKADRKPAGKRYTLWTDMVAAGKDAVLPADDGKYSGADEVDPQVLHGVQQADVQIAAHTQGDLAGSGHHDHIGDLCDAHRPVKIFRVQHHRGKLVDDHIL